MKVVSFVRPTNPNWNFDVLRSIVRADVTPVYRYLKEEIQRFALNPNRFTNTRREIVWNQNAILVLNKAIEHERNHGPFDESQFTELRLWAELDRLGMAFKFISIYCLVCEITFEPNQCHIEPWRIKYPHFMSDGQLITDPDGHILYAQTGMVSDIFCPPS